jgi:hypothetical protein
MLRPYLALAFSLAMSTYCHSQIHPPDHSCEGDCRTDFPACQSVWQPNISAVFLGRATDIHEEDVPIMLHEKKELTGRQLVTFEVEESFVGVSGKIATVTSGGDLCGFPFSKGREYLVYGRHLPNGEIYVSICSSTKWKKEAVEDLKYLRSLPTAPHGGTIYGTAFRYMSPVNERLMALRKGTSASGQKIEIQGTSQKYEVTVDAQGKFTLSGLPPGRYTVLLNADGAVVHASPPGLSPTVDLADMGCARFDFWIDPFAKKNLGTPQGSDASTPKEISKNDHPH